MTEPKVTTTSERVGDTVVVTITHPTWASIPPEYRATETIIRDLEFDHVADETVEWLKNPRCIVAVFQPRLRRRWMPCRQDVARGEALCARHGGPRVQPKQPATRGELEAEIKRLQTRLSKWEA